VVWAEEAIRILPAVVSKKKAALLSCFTKFWMQTVKLAYGKNGLEIEIPTSYAVLHSKHASGIPEREAILQALRNPIQSPPLAQLVKPNDKIVVTHTDITRATPNNRLIPVILEELEKAGLPKSNITLINALGTHRAQTDAELRGMLGDAVVDSYRCVQHDAFTDNKLFTLPARVCSSSLAHHQFRTRQDGHGDFVTGAGHHVRVNRELAEADVRSVR